jgi:hypothetical protein
VRETADGGIVVGFMDPVAVMQMTGNPEVAAVAPEVRARLERVRAALARPLRLRAATECCGHPEIA